MRIVFMFSLLMLASCAKDDDRLKDFVEEQKESEVSVENENQKRKARAMEADLSRRHRFFQAVKGIYEGRIEGQGANFNIRLTLTPSLPPVSINRTRQLEEITADLNSLFLSAQIIQWDPNNSAAAVGCRVSQIKPDLRQGTIAISSDSCPNLYSIKITERGFRASAVENSRTAARLARQVLNGDILEIDSVSGQVQPSTTSHIYRFIATRVEE